MHFLDQLSIKYFMFFLENMHLIKLKAKPLCSEIKIAWPHLFLYFEIILYILEFWYVYNLGYWMLTFYLEFLYFTLCYK